MRPNFGSPRTITCDACGGPAICTTQESYPDGGLCFDPYSMSYYDGFFDMPFSDSRVEPWRVCRDCAQKFFDLFPALMDKYEKHIEFLLADGQIIAVGAHETDEHQTGCCG